MKVVAIITSRWDSKRLPGKALALINGKTMLQRIVDNARQSEFIDEVVVATSISSKPIIDFCEANGMGYYAGAEDDILDRLYHTARLYRADTVVRIWGDCPLLTEGIIDKFFEGCPVIRGVDYYFSGKHNPTGYWLDMMPFSLLRKAWLEITNPKDREWIHSYFINKDNARSDCYYQIYTMEEELAPGDWTLDTPEDLERIREIVKRSERNN